MKKHIISIAGRPGSGKTSTGKLIAKKLDLKHFSTGDMMRELGRQRGHDITTTNAINEDDRTFDDLVDGELRRINLEEDGMVIDSRMAWHFVPASFKVYLMLDFETAANRILADKDNIVRAESENIHLDRDEFIEDIKKRLEIEERRYMNLYGVNPFDTSNYDLVIDTGENDLESVATQIAAAYRQWVKDN